jgi:hypothetical protein
LGLVLFVAIIAIINLGLGMLARRGQAWVNYVVAFSACLFLAIGLLVMSNVRPGARAGMFLGIVVAASLLYSSVNNLDKLRRARREE